MVFQWNWGSDQNSCFIGFGNYVKWSVLSLEIKKIEWKNESNWIAALLFQESICSQYLFNLLQFIPKCVNSSCINIDKSFIGIFFKWENFPYILHNTTPLNVLFALCQFIAINHISLKDNNLWQSDWRQSYQFQVQRCMSASPVQVCIFLLPYLLFLESAKKSL